MRRTLAATILAAAIGALQCAPLLAADNLISKTAPDLTSVRAKVKAKDFQAAIAELTPMLDKSEHADVYNLLGFSYRKSGDLGKAASFYAKALELDANHLGALEYQGQMFVELGDMKKARANLARLVKLCPKGCEERTDLQKAITAAARTRKAS